MSRKSRRAPIHLDAKGLCDLPVADLHAVLRGADDLIARGGRTLLKRILRGSRNKDVLARGLDQSPVYGHFKNLSDEDALARIDWTILNGFLRIEHINRLPVLTYTRKGWEIERENFADELLAIGQGRNYRRRAVYPAVSRVEEDRLQESPDSHTRSHQTT